MHRFVKHERLDTMLKEKRAKPKAISEVALVLKTAESQAQVVLQALHDLEEKMVIFIHLSLSCI